MEWLLLTTVAVEDFAQACERLSWYAVRWSIEVFHRTLKSGCRIEDRRLAEAGNLQACLALDMVVAWRVLYLTRLGRQTPDLPCSVFFEEEEWKALYAYHHQSADLPNEPPTLRLATRMVAQIGGFLGRKGDGDPGATVLWWGLEARNCGMDEACTGGSSVRFCTTARLSAWNKFELDMPGTTRNISENSH